MAVREEGIRTSLARNWWSFIGRGIIAILFGLAAIGWPAITLLVLLTLFGIFVLIDGVMALGASFQALREKRRWWTYALEGVAGIIVGILVFAIPELTARALLLFIAIWAIVVGILKIGMAIELRQQIQGEWTVATGGIISILFGAFLLAFPAEGALAFVILIGIFAIVVGSLWISLGISLWNWQRAVKKAEEEMKKEEEERKRAA
ncbi:MAG: HdeD family acid-resistance protein [Actinobacteria bacterium]|nr:MAG: HdeD family acid-resistance protein [Actinomycetota bacterium]